MASVIYFLYNFLPVSGACEHVFFWLSVWFSMPNASINSIIYTTFMTKNTPALKILFIPSISVQCYAGSFFFLTTNFLRDHYSSSKKKWIVILWITLFRKLVLSYIPVLRDATSKVLIQMSFCIIFFSIFFFILQNAISLHIVFFFQKSDSVKDDFFSSVTNRIFFRWKDAVAKGWGVRLRHAFQ